MQTNLLMTPPVHAARPRRLFTPPTCPAVAWQERADLSQKLELFETRMRQVSESADLVSQVMAASGGGDGAGGGGTSAEAVAQAAELKEARASVEGLKADLEAKTAHVRALEGLVADGKAAAAAAAAAAAETGGASEAGAAAAAALEAKVGSLEGELAGARQELEALRAELTSVKAALAGAEASAAAAATEAAARHASALEALKEEHSATMDKVAPLLNPRSYLREHFSPRAFPTYLQSQQNPLVSLPFMSSALNLHSSTSFDI